MTRARCVLAAAVLMTVAAAGLPARAGADTRPQVTVSEAGGFYSVEATFLVDHPASLVMAVLTDYEQIPRFAPGVRLSLVLERAGNRAIVEQEAVARVMLFSKRVHLLLEVHEQPDSLTFGDRCGQSFAHYEGAWTLTEHDGVTEVAYDLTAKPAFSVPGFLLERLLQRDARQMIEGLETEIAARATRRDGPG